jgi:excisionase family DNA binding protein
LDELSTEDHDVLVERDPHAFSDYRDSCSRSFAMALQNHLPIEPMPSHGNPEPSRGKILAFVPDPLLDTDEAAAVMKIHPKTLQKLARRGSIHGIRVGKLWRFRASHIQDWIDRQ